MLPIFKPKCTLSSAIPVSNASVACKPNCGVAQRRHYDRKHSFFKMNVHLEYSVLKYPKILDVFPGKLSSTEKSSEALASGVEV